MDVKEIRAKISVYISFIFICVCSFFCCSFVRSFVCFTCGFVCLFIVLLVRFILFHFIIVNVVNILGVTACG